MVPYLMWSALSFAANVATTFVSRGFNVAVTVSELVNIFVYSRSGWFLIQLFIAEILVMVCYAVTKTMNLPNRKMYMLSVAIWILICILPINSILHFYKYKWLFLFLLMGITVGEAYEDYTRSAAIFIIACLVFVSLIISICRNNFMVTSEAYNDYFRNISLKSFNAHSIIFCVYQIICGVLGVSFIVWLGEIIDKTILKKFFSTIGYYSIDIYLIHMFVVHVIASLTKFRINDDGRWSALCLIIALITCAIISMLSRYLLRKSDLYLLSIGRKS